MQAPDGNNDVEVKYLQAVASSWGEDMRTGHLEHKEAWQALNTTVMRTLEYPLPALTLTEKECRHIMAPVLQRGLSSSGICRNMAHDVVYVPLEFQGFGLNFPYTTQGIDHIEVLIQHGQANTITGQLIRASLEEAKLEVGLGGGLFMQDFKKFGKLATPGWITHTWDFLHKYSMTAEDTTKPLKLRRVGDAFLTQAFYENGIKGAALAQANWCRLYLQAITLSDIMTGDQKEITSAAWDGKREEGRPKYYVWPNQGRPGRRDWQTWHHALDAAFGCHRRWLA
jgi:hypothetical protein